MKVRSRHFIQGLWIANLLACGDVVKPGVPAEDAAVPGGDTGAAIDANGVDGAGGGGLSIAPAALAFGPVSTAVEPPSQMLTIANRTSAPIQLAFAFSGPSATSFAIEQNTCTQPLAPAGECAVKVKLVVSQLGPYSASLDVTGAGMSASALLSATGVSAELSISPASFDFGAVAMASASSHAFTLTNFGEAELPPPALTLSDPAFSVEGNTCTQPLASHMNCNFSVKFVPATAGSRGATISAATGELLAAADVSGRGTAQLMIGISGASGGNGTVLGCTSSCTVTVESSPVTMTATPSGNSTFDGWSGDAASCGTDTTCPLTITKPIMSVAAGFFADLRPPDPNEAR